MAKRSTALIKKSSGRQLKPCTGAHRTDPIKDESDRKHFIDWFYLQVKKAPTARRKAIADRNLMIVLTALNTAFRAEDLLQLRVKDIDRGFISIKENKTGKIQNFSLNGELFQKLTDYVKRHGLERNEYLFQPHVKSVNGRPYLEPVTRQRLNKVINQATYDCGIPYSVGLHGLRKTFGYAYMKNGGKLITLMKMYNHSNSNTTLRYVEWTIDDIQKEREAIFIDSDGVVTKAKRRR